MFLRAFAGELCAAIIYGVIMGKGGESYDNIRRNIASLRHAISHVLDIEQGTKLRLTTDSQYSVRVNYPAPDVSFYNSAGYEVKGLCINKKLLTVVNRTWTNIEAHGGLVWINVVKRKVVPFIWKERLPAGAIDSINGWSGTAVSPYNGKHGATVNHSEVVAVYKNESARRSFKSPFGSRGASLRLSPRQSRVKDANSDSADAKDAQRELSERYVHYGVGRYGFPGLNFQGPLIAVLGFLALCAGYGISALAERGGRRANVPNPRRSNQSESDNQKGC